MYNVGLYWQDQPCSPLHDPRYCHDRVAYKDGFDPDNPSACCDLCCENKDWPQIWNLYGNGTCRCYGQLTTSWKMVPPMVGIKYGTGDWSGACEFRRPPATPEGLDSKKFKIANDTRTVALHRATARHKCGGDDDHTTLAQVKQKAVELSTKQEATEYWGFKWACGQCGAAQKGYEQHWGQDTTAIFCATALNGPNKTRLEFAKQSYTQNEQWWQKPACQKTKGNFTVDSVDVGLDGGKFEIHRRDDMDFPTVQQCPHPPYHRKKKDDSCEPIGGPECHCNATHYPNCEPLPGSGPGCSCSTVLWPAEIVVSYLWYSLEGKKPLN